MQTLSFYGFKYRIKIRFYRKQNKKIDKKNTDATITFQQTFKFLV